MNINLCFLDYEAIFQSKLNVHNPDGKYIGDK